MTHPLIPEINKLAAPVAEELDLELVETVFQTNKNPPVLQLKVRNLHGDTSLNDCEQMSRLLEEILDSREIIPSAYVLEISSPGICEQLTTERDFITFKGFPISVKTKAPYRQQTEWQGNLLGRDERAVYLNLKGKTISIPINLIAQVQLESKT